MKKLKVSETARYTYQYLLSLNQEFVIIKPKEIAPHVGSHPEIVRKSLRKLEAYGYIKRVGISMYQVFRFSPDGDCDEKE